MENKSKYELFKKEMQKYFEELEKKVKEVYHIARNARKKGIDPYDDVEIVEAPDVAARVEGIVGPKGIAERIRELVRKKSREESAFILAEKIASGEWFSGSLKERIEQAIRTSLALITEGVVAAPIDGVAKIDIKKNKNGSEYLVVYYAGPIRSAGGTAAALSVVLADIARKAAGLSRYEPTDEEIERTVEEINLYHARVSRLQYKPTDEQVRIIVKNCPVQISGISTSDLEVSAYRDIERIETNRIRGGMCLVIGEGIAQKAKKLLKYTKKYALGWDWIESVLNIQKADNKEKKNEKKEAYLKCISDLVGGRPIFSYPGAKGGFRLRYGRTRTTGLASKAIHPSAMYLLGEFLAVGTQMSIEKPGKGMVTVPCDSIEPPIVLLKNGDVIKVPNVDLAKKIRDNVQEILFLGDLLVSYGDFLKAEPKLAKPGFCEEWWYEMCKDKGIKVEDPFNVGWEQAKEISLKYDIPLHPKYIFFYGDVSKEDILSLRNWLKKGKIEKVGDKTRLVVELGPEKRILELICVPHKVFEKWVIIEEESALPLIETLRLKENIEIPDAESALELINKISPFKIMNKSGTRIGARMGRPEKADYRRMKPPVHALFPIGLYGGKQRDIIKAASERSHIIVDIVRTVCPKTGKEIFGYKCEHGRAKILNTCPKCGRKTEGNVCERCGVNTIPYYKASLLIRELVNNIVKRLNVRPERVKGVKGLFNENKMYEPLEKGLLRAYYDVYVFRDGTCRYDATDIPITHFKPKEIGTSVEKLRELGYHYDYQGNPLENDDQIVELKVQDIIIPHQAGEYFVKVAKFVDDLLQKVYEMRPYYNVNKNEDLIGHLVIGMAPHTSAGVLGRIIGFTRARAIFAHPYFHACKRRNCDGDEDSIMLLLDALINFSKYYLSDKSGGKMDAPLVLTIKINPAEVDDEVHCMEVVDHYPLEFYQAATEEKPPDSVGIETVGKRLGKPEQYFLLNFSHHTSQFDLGPSHTIYSRLKTMEEKVEKQLGLGEKIRAVDERDMAERVISFHFIKDIYGNLQAFGRQVFRCVDCNEKYRRPPLMGKCKKCGGKIVLTVSKGGIEKYVGVSKKIAEKYNISNYLKQRLMLVESDLEQIFGKEIEVEERKTQKTLADFI